MSNTNQSNTNQGGAQNLVPNWGRLGGQLGVILCLMGFLVLFLGWNGAAGKNVIMAQFPYLISGGMVGLAIVIVGAAMLIVQSAREDRARMEATMERLIVAIEADRAAAAAPPMAQAPAVPTDAVGRPLNPPYN